MRVFWAILIAVIGLSIPQTGDAPLTPGAAWADDGGGDGDGSDGSGSDGSGDDGGSDDGSDDGSSGSSSSSSSKAGKGGGGGSGIDSGQAASPREVVRGIRRLFRGTPAPQQRTRPRSQAAAEPPRRAPNEIVTRGLSEDDTAALRSQGYEVIERADLGSLALTLRRLRVPADVTLDEARSAIRALPTGETADFNHFYRTGGDTAPIVSDAAADALACEGLHCPARALVRWPETIGPKGCGAPVTIGMVDTGLNPEHEALAGARIAVMRVAPEDFTASEAVHGTAVAALLVGDPASRSPGLVPGLPLVAVDAFHRQGGDERADAFTLVRALDHLSQQGARVINLSLAGPPNDVLEATLAQLATQRGITIVAAAGNGGPRAEPAYPAAYDNVIAVTAVDSSGTAYRRAGRGPHVDLAAPGVEVWTAASINGARWKTGTSFAAPFVTAAAALWLQREPMLTPAQLRERLLADATDLGPEGRDEIYGSGLLDLHGNCPGEARLTPAAAR